MSINVLMPALSPTMEKGNLAKWLKKEGEAVKSGDVLAEIETDKATMEVEAVDEGILAKILIPAGTADVLVNTPIAVIAEEGENVSSASAPNKGPPAKAEPAPVKTTEPKTQSPSQMAAAVAEKAAEPKQNERVFASPLARRIAKDAGVDLSVVEGSGPHGRIIERDIRAALADGLKPAAKSAGPDASVVKVSAQPSASVAAAGMSDETIKKFYLEGSFEEISHDSMRQTIARRLVEAKQTIPHFYLSIDCELTALMRLRAEVNDGAPKDGDGKPAYKISVNDFIVKALAMALKAVPEANASWTQGAMLRHKYADVGVAVSIPGGLITPIVRQAEGKSLSAISNEIKSLAARAKQRKLKPEEYSGGSSSVSNLGMYGIKNFAAIINPPQATILAVGAGEDRVIVKDGAPAVAHMMSVTLSTDHRAVDGVLGAQLLAAFKNIIERPMAMLV